MQGRSQPDSEGDMDRSLGIIDTWMQHPTPRFLAEPMFDSIREEARRLFLAENAGRIFGIAAVP